MNHSIAIIGAGNGGQAYAGYLALKGHEVKLFDVMEKTVTEIQNKGGIEISGNSDLTGLGHISFASIDICKVIDGSTIILIILPAIYHDSIAARIAPHLKDGQLVLLNPSAPLGAIAFWNQLKNNGCRANVLIGSTNTLLFAVRIVENGYVYISGQKKFVSGAAYPSYYNNDIYNLVQNVLPQIHFKNDIIYNGLENMNALVHPGPVLMNIGRIESGATFEYYTDMTPSQCKLIEVLDKERIALGTACGFDIPDFVASFKELYPETYGNTVYEVLTNNPSYKGIKAPTTIRNRYLYEDVPYSLQAFQSLGKILGVTTPCIDSLITLARYMIPSLKDGSTLDNLGLTGITKEEFLKICREQK